MPKVVVVDYGIGNLLSVRRGLEHCGAEVTVTADPETILSASLVVLPGVGAFADGMAELRRTGLDAVVVQVAEKGIPLLGICLGMQLLLDESEEFGTTRGLGLIPGKVISIPTTTAIGGVRKIPHIGWNELVLPEALTSWDDTLLTGLPPEPATYFVHSFMAVPKDQNDRIADCFYDEERISAVIGRGSIFGCQFHPEKSGETGLHVLRNFMSL